MDLTKELLFFFSAIGVFNASVLSLYFLFFIKPKKQSYLFLGILLLMISIRIWKSIFFYFNPELSKLYLQVGLSACFLIGPFLYLYVLSNFKRLAAQFWIPVSGLCIAVVMIVGILYPYSIYPELWGMSIYRSISYIWLFFILLSIILIVKNIDFKKRINYDDFWALNVVIGVTIIWMAYYLLSSLTSYIIGALSFTFVFYFSALIIYHNREYFFKLKKRKQQSTSFSSEEIEDLTEKIKQQMDVQTVQKDPNLQLNDLAKRVHLTPHKLSEFINSHFNQNFMQFINSYRIKDSISMMKTHPHYSIEEIAFQCGFNSTSAFYNAFKKETNSTPAKYMAK